MVDDCKVALRRGYTARQVVVVVVVVVVAEETNRITGFTLPLPL